MTLYAPLHPTYLPLASSPPPPCVEVFEHVDGWLREGSCVLLLLFDRVRYDLRIGRCPLEEEVDAEVEEVLGVVGVEEVVEGDVVVEGFAKILTWVHQTM